MCVGSEFFVTSTEVSDLYTLSPRTTSNNWFKFFMLEKLKEREVGKMTLRQRINENTFTMNVNTDHMYPSQPFRPRHKI